MSREDEQPRRNIKAKTGEPTPLAIPSDRLQTRLPPLQRAEEAIDQGTEPPRKNSSIRYTSPYNTHLPHSPGIPTTNTPVRRLTNPRDVDTHAMGRQTQFDEDEDDHDTDYEETFGTSEMKNYPPPGRRATGPRAEDGANNYVGGRRATGSRENETYTTGRQASQRDGNVYNTGRQTNPRDSSNTYVTGRQTTRNIPPNQTRDQRRNGQSPPPNNKQNYPRNKQAAKTQDFSAQRRAHWLLPVGIGMMAMLALWLLGSNLVSWGTQIYNDVHYGNPRTFQIDAVVGHNDNTNHPSHFIAININRQAIVFEMMGGDPQKAITYVAPVVIAGPNGDRAPITVEFRDVTGDRKADMILHIHLPTQDQISIFVNDGSKFRPSNNNDKIHL